MSLYHEPMGDPDRGQQRDLDEQAALRAVVEGTATDTGEEFFAALVKNLARALDVHGAWVTEFQETQGQAQGAGILARRRVRERFRV